MTKIYIKENVWNSEKKSFYVCYFIFEQSKAKHEKLIQFAGKSQYYWFNGLTGKNWFRGGWFPSPIINPSKNIANNIQGFTDGTNVYLLRKIVENVPNLKEY